MTTTSRGSFPDFSTWSPTLSSCQRLLTPAPLQPLPSCSPAPRSLCYWPTAPQGRRPCVHVPALAASCAGPLGATRCTGSIPASVTTLMGLSHLCGPLLLAPFAPLLLVPGSLCIPSIMLLRPCFFRAARPTPRLALPGLRPAVRLLCACVLQVPGRQWPHRLNPCRPLGACPWQDPVRLHPSPPALPALHIAGAMSL